MSLSVFFGACFSGSFGFFLPNSIAAVIIKLVSRFLFGGELWETNWLLLVTAGYFLLF
jgi:hypothetical protein